MNKKKNHVWEITTSNMSYWSGIEPIHKIIEQLKECQFNGATHIDFYYCEITSVLKSRLETDKEYKARKKSELAMNKSIKERELKLLEQLSKKYKVK